MLIDDGFICHCSGNPAHKFIYGFYLYHLLPPKDKNKSGEVTHVCHALFELFSEPGQMSTELISYPNVSVRVGCVDKNFILGHTFQTIKDTAFIFMPPFEKGGAYCVAHVGRYVGLP